MEEKPGARYFLAVRLRGTVGDSPDVEKTLDSLLLVRPFQARLLENNGSMGGMLWKVKSIVAWGEVDAGTLEWLLRKRCETEVGSHRPDEEFVRRRLGMESFSDLAKSVVAGEVDVDVLWKAGLKPRFRLHPPRGGFKRSTRRAFTDGGELGYRGSEINGLVRRMI